MSRLSIAALLASLIVSPSGCAPETQATSDTSDRDRTEQALSGAARRPRAAVIRDVAASMGLTNGVLLAGIAQVETGLSHCWSEARWACQGPYSSSCGGPVIAGAADGPCEAQQGGLGLYQFDGGTYADTLLRDGADILSLEGNIARAVVFVTTIVDRHVEGIEGAEEALAWINAVPVVTDDATFAAWTELLACRYNGRCGSMQQAAKYRDATLEVLSELGAPFWRVDDIEPEQREDGEPSSGCGG